MAREGEGAEKKKRTKQCKKKKLGTNKPPSQLKKKAHSCDPVGPFGANPFLFWLEPPFFPILPIEMMPAL